jgi:hypothetical protein
MHVSPNTILLLYEIRRVGMAIGYVQAFYGSKNVYTTE